MEKSIDSAHSENRGWFYTLIILLLFLLILLLKNCHQSPNEPSDLDFEPNGPNEEELRPDRKDQGIEDLIERKGTEYQLSKAHWEKMELEISRLKKSEQYTLKAASDGWFDCGTCKAQYGEERIFLQINEVWRYGVSSNGDKRYSTGFYKKNNVYYETQLVANYFDCLVEEKKKIYFYVLLPENLSRDRPLRRPPMNLNSN